MPAAELMDCRRVMTFVLRLWACVCLVAALAAGAAEPAAARKSIKKSIWGPTERNGVSQFPIYRDLGAGIYQMTLHWNEAARRRPKHPTDPADPAYRWPADVDYAIAEGRKYGIRVLVQVSTAPRWANGGHSGRWAPRRPRDFGRFMQAVSRRYPGVRYW